ncbi:OB-fold nucleic acid binding domain-containing protein [Candidatus Pacearchaeota archaeon]|nr:OB-fold nucleic acid binding domain-containing protein [Candidatus Pacearchaeota archaeon]
MADFKRQIAYKLRVGDILSGKPIMDNERFGFLELDNKRVVRVNIVANVVEKYNSSEKQYVSLTIDDASGQIRIKIFGDDVAKFQNINQGDTIMVVGLLRWYNNELYLTPEIMKIQDPRYLLVRKLEFEKEMPKVVDKNEILALTDQIKQRIKDSEPEGISSEKLIMELHSAPELINQEIKKALEQGIIYEPRPGLLRWLGV